MGFRKEMQRLLLCGSEKQMRRRSRSSKVSMDSKLWAQLPQELLDRILSWLPLPVFFRLRLVCKRWNDLVRCSRFRSLSAQNGRQADWLVLLRPWDCIAYAPSAAKWYRFDLESLPVGCQVENSDGGLLLCSRDEQMLVCNFLTKAWHELPRLKHAKCLRSIGMAVDSRSKNWYKIVVVGYSGTDFFKSPKTEIYDSRVGSWNLGSSQLQEGVVLFPGRMTLSDGVLYCITSRPSNIAAYNIQEQAWHQFDFPSSVFYSYPSLVACSSGIFLLGCASEEGVSVWKLEEGSNWSKPVLISLYSFPYEQFSCVGVDELVFITFQAHHKLLVYRTRECQWEWLPRCEFGKQNEGTSLSLTPGFDAVHNPSALLKEVCFNTGNKDTPATKNEDD